MADEEKTIFPKNFKTSLLEAKAHCDHFADHLPTHIDVLSLGVWSKLPYKALVIRDALLWRTEELGRNAYHALDRDDRAAGILLSRAVLESTALLWRLRQMIDTRQSSTIERLDEELTKLLMGWKSDAEFPKAINILTLVDHLDKEISGVRRAYDTLSEVAHPNYGGVHGLFAQIDSQNFITRFGRDLRGTEAAEAAAAALSASLGLFSFAYNAIGDAVQTWLSELSPLSGPRDAD